MWRRSKGPSARKLKLNHTCQAMKDGSEVGSQNHRGELISTLQPEVEGEKPWLLSCSLQSRATVFDCQNSGNLTGILENSLQDLASFHNAEIRWKNERQFRLHAQALCHTATVAITVIQLWSTFSKVSCAFNYLKLFQHFYSSRHLLFIFDNFTESFSSDGWTLQKYF